MALAEHLCGSVEMFVEKMNKRAQQLGMKNTNFVNTNGLPVANHYSSAYDIAIMTRELLQHEASHELLTRKQAMVQVGLPGKEKDFELINTNKLLHQYEGTLGVKTGFTQDAMFCLSAAAERDGSRLIAVILGAETSAIRFDEAKKLLDYGFANYETVTVAKKGDVKRTVALEKSDRGDVDVAAGENCSVLIKKGEKKKVETRVELDGNIDAPVKKGDKMGQLVIYLDGVEAERFPLVAAERAGKASVKDLYIRMMKKIA